MASYKSGQRRPPRRKWKRNLAIIFVLIIVCFSARLISSNFIAELMKPYIPFNNDPLVARVYVTKTNTNHEWIVHISTIDRSGKLIARTDSYPQPCDKWQLRADVINIQSWLAPVLGLPSEWYRIIDLEGFDCYSHGYVDASLSKSILVDGITTAIMRSWVYGKLISSNPLTSNSIGPDGKTYDAVITLTTLSLIPGS